ANEIVSLLKSTLVASNEAPKRITPCSVRVVLLVTVSAVTVLTAVRTRVLALRLLIVYRPAFLVPVPATTIVAPWMKPSLAQARPSPRVIVSPPAFRANVSEAPGPALKLGATTR